MSKATWYCPRCDSYGRKQWQWRPDLDPKQERYRCYDCGYDTGWVDYGMLRARQRVNQ
jgi:transposase-like protein